MRQLPPQSNPTFGFSKSPFGECCVASSSDGVCALTFPENRNAAMYDLAQRFPETEFSRDDNVAAGYVKMIFDENEIPKLHPIGTDFQQSVWAALSAIPVGSTTTYAKIAEAIGRPKAVRAVGTAVGANPIGYLIPCHRVIRTDGGLGGFRWGLEIKMMMLEWEKKIV